MLTSAQAIRSHNNKNDKNDKNDKFEFNNGNFNYVVEFTQNLIGSDKEPVSTIKIVCTHINEFYVWSYTTSEYLKDTDNIESKQTKSVINYDPDLLYNILLGYKNGNLDKVYTINFPDKYNGLVFPLVVEIISSIPYTNENNVAKLYLKNNPIGEVERCGHKFLRMNELGKKEQDVRIQYLEKLVETLVINDQKNQEQINEMKNLIQILLEKTNENQTNKNQTNKNQTPEEKKSKIAKLAATLYTDPRSRYILKEQLGLLDYVVKDNCIAPKDNFYVTKNNFDNVFSDYVKDTALFGGVLDLYAKKSDLNTQVTRIDAELNKRIKAGDWAPCVTKAEIATLATKAELNTYATRVELNALVARVAPLGTKAELTSLATKAELNTCAASLRNMMF